jgi:hypothetical protein
LRSLTHEIHIEGLVFDVSLPEAVAERLVFEILQHLTEHGVLAFFVALVPLVEVDRHRPIDFDGRCIAMR